MKTVNLVLADSIIVMRSPTLYKPSRIEIQISAGLLLAASLYVINIALATPISLIQTFVLVLLYISAFLGLMQVYKLIAWHRYLRAAGLLFLILLCIIPYVYVCVYFLLPWLGEPLHRSDVPFDWPQFLERVLSGLTLTALSAAIFFLMEIKRLDKRQGKAALKSHFIRNLLTMTKHYIHTQLGHQPIAVSQEMMGLVEYTLWIDERELTLIDWKSEWKQLVGLARLQETLRGEKVLKLELEASHGPALIPPLVWVTLVENALTHGQFGANEPIRIILRQRSRKLYFHCINQYSTLSRSQGGTGKGLKDVHQRLATHFTASEWGCKIMDNGTYYHLLLMTGVPKSA